MKTLLIFLIEDDIDDQEIFSLIMEEAYPRVECVFAKDGVEAMEKIENETFIPNLIFIDLNMPRMNGMECLAGIKNIKRLDSIPIYVYSTSAEQQIIMQCMELGATGFIMKHTNIDNAKKEFQRVIADLKSFHVNESF